VSTSFNEIVEEILNLPIDEKEEIKNIIDRSLVEDMREDIYKNYRTAKQEEKDGKLHFSSDLNSLKQQL
jgi:hypothetical protein